MKRKNYKLLILFICALIQLQGSTIIKAEDEVIEFSDIPSSHWAYLTIHQLRGLGITNGKANNQFGLGDTITRAEFVTFLVRLRGWDIIEPKMSSYIDNQDASTWYYSYIETAFINGVLSDTDSQFRPSDPITREEMAIMIVKSLGYEWLSTEMTDLESPFLDVTTNIGYISLLNDFGIINGIGEGNFAPKNTAKREEAAAILIRMYNKINSPIENINGFYAISSYAQKNLFSDFQSISFGWADLSFDEERQNVNLIITRPNGYKEPIALAQSTGNQVFLSIYATDSQKVTDKNIGILTYLLSIKDRRDLLVDQIIDELTVNEDFDGIVIDFEDMRGQANKENFSIFLFELNNSLDQLGRSLTVMVPPITYYNAYDYKAIGEYADRVVLMAHDYNAKVMNQDYINMGYTYTPLTPIKEIYESLKAITDSVEGVQDATKISLQISFATAQWGIGADGTLANSKPYTPDYEKLYNRLIDDQTVIDYDPISQNPKALYYNELDKLNYIIWYEDSRSINQKVNLGKMFGINNISIWRLGNIPNYNTVEGKEIYMDVMDSLKN